MCWITPDAGDGDTGEGTGDVQWIAEVVRRRFARYLDEQVESGADADSDPGAEAVESSGATRRV